MPNNEVNPNQKPENLPEQPEPEKGSLAGTVVAIVVVIIVGLIAGYFFFVDRDEPGQGTPDTADNIRDIFRYDEPVPPTTTPPVIPEPQPPTTTPPETEQPAVPRPAPAPQPLVYENPAWHLRLALPPPWQFDARSSTNNIAVFVGPGPQDLAAIEVYPNLRGTTLAELENIFTLIPEVSSVTRATVAGQPAIIYRTNSLFSSGFAFVYRENIYYLHGAFLNPAVLDGFSLR